MPRPSNCLEDEALDFTCPVCEVPPGSWCIYVGHNARAGRETTRIHLPRLPYTALRAIQAFDRQEEDTLRRWLRRYGHILIKDSTSP